MELEKKRNSLLTMEDYGHRGGTDRWYPMPVIDPDRLLLDDGYEHGGREHAVKEICGAINLQRSINYGEDVDEVCLKLETELQYIIDEYNSCVIESNNGDGKANWTEFDSRAEKLLDMAAAIRNTCVERGLLPAEREAAASFLVRTHGLSRDPMWFPFRGGFESDYRALKEYMSKYRLEPCLKYLEVEVKAVSGSFGIEPCYEKALEILSIPLKNGTVVDRRLWFLFREFICLLEDGVSILVIRSRMPFLEDAVKECARNG